MTKKIAIAIVGIGKIARDQHVPAIAHRPSVAVERWQQHARQDRSQPTAPNAEYPHLYEHFATLVRSRQIDVDVAPTRLVADALLCGRRIEVEPFVDR